MNYALSAMELLQKLGVDQPTGTQWLQNLKEKEGITLPKVYCDFMQYAVDSPLFETSDLWTGAMCPMNMVPYSFYEYLQEAIQERMTEELEEGRLGELSRMPVERWPERTEDFLIIGSDYGAGICMFGIRASDLQEDNPPVYSYFDEDVDSEWKLEWETLSDYFLWVLTSILSCVDYNTAEEALEEYGRTWSYLDEADEESDLEAAGISLEEVRPLDVSYTKAFLCWEETKELLYVGLLEDEEWTLIQISKEEED